MLQLRPNCEHCNKDLPADSGDARICSYECTFCADCVDSILNNVCPNCGGGFVPRPIRPQTVWREGTSLIHQPPTDVPVHKPVDIEAHSAFSGPVGKIDPSKR